VKKTNPSEAKEEKYYGDTARRRSDYQGGRERR